MTKEERAIETWKKLGIEQTDPENDEEVAILAAALDAHALDALSEATRIIRALFDEPHGCVFCDSGTLRSRAKGHDDQCPFILADAFLHKAAAP